MGGFRLWNAVGTIKTVETLDVGLNVLREHGVKGYGLNLESPPQAHVLNIYSLAGNLFSG